GNDPDDRGLRVEIAGHGLLAAAIGEAMSAVPHLAGFTVHDGVELIDLPDPEPVGLIAPSNGQLVITASDAWDCRDCDRLQAMCVEHRVSWLPVRTELGRTVIGPLYTPGAAGCVGCAELRRSLADDHYLVRLSARDRYAHFSELPAPWLTNLAA